MERIWLAAIAIAALALRVWNLDQNGWGAEYYSAAVRSMASSAHNFLYCAFDPAGFISVDKPPVALWVQVASVKLFAFVPLALLLPQALEGVACVGLVYLLVRPRFGAHAALLAALFLALTPVMVAVNRTNNIDSALTLVLLVGAWALLHAAETGKRSWLFAAAALVGVAFNTKMLAGFIVLPAFYATYGLAAPTPLPRRLVDLVLASMVVAAVSISWIAFFDLTSPGERPYAGSSGAKNSMRALAFGHNAASRFALPEMATRTEGTLERAETVAQRLFVRAPTGWLRLAHGQLAAQAGWLLPFAIAALAMNLRRPRGAWTPAAISLLFWAAWAAIYIAVYSFAGGIVHFYYLATLAPPFAALAGIGAAQLWVHRGPALPITLLCTLAWQLFLQSSALGWEWTDASSLPAWENQLHAGVAASVAVASIGLAFMRAPRASIALASLALLALLGLPLAWSLSSVLVPGQGILPSADLRRLEVSPSPDLARAVDVGPLVDFLERERAGERFLLATTTTRIAAPIIVRTGEPVMAMGGFHGLDRAIDAEGLAHRIQAREVRFVMLGDAAAPSRRLGADVALAPLSEWVRANGRRVPGARWRSQSMPRGFALYDMRAVAGPS